MITDRIFRWNSVSRRQAGNLHAAAGEEAVGSDKQGIGALALKGGKGRIDLAARAGIEDMDLQPDVVFPKSLRTTPCNSLHSTSGDRRYGSSNGVRTEF